MDSKVPKIISDFQFHDTSFNLLMQKRISRVLLICSNYDAFMLEEDGRIDEQIFNEYVSLNLRYPPVFIRTNSAEEAFELLQNNAIDLVVSMLSVSDMVGPFNLANSIKEKYPSIPIIVLTPFSREVSIKLEKEDLSAIDYVFSWLGTADLLLAITKLIEDKMNAEHDIKEVGVQCILLVEDSVRFYSSYLPNIYKIILKQSKSFMDEALNEHQKMLRMRGRPKILLATTYDEAIELYEKYKKNLLGIISDIRYKKNHQSEKGEKMGFELFKKVSAEDPHLPFLLQSSELDNKEIAEDLGVGFLHKGSKKLSMELRDYISRNFAFGDFVFRDPKSDKEINRAKNLKELQQKILKISNDCLLYHSQRNHFSKWLNARAIFPIAQLFKYVTVNDFEDLDDVRKYIYDSITSFRRSKGQGVIAKFDRNKFDEYLSFSRIGDGSIGGKARGLAFINSIIKKNKLHTKFEDTIVTIPKTVVISTDVFDEFMEANKLYQIALSNASDDKILESFVKAHLPASLHEDLKAFLSVVNKPIAIRSSSKLEDSHYQPFAGIYSTYMIPNIPNKKKMLKMLAQAIKSVYASVYYNLSKAYMNATSNVIDEEKMGIILQEVCGSENNEMFYPTISGVARSINFYPISPEKHEDGIATIGFGLGKLIVEGGKSLRFSPKYPKKVLQLSTPEIALRDTQKEFYALDLAADSFVSSTDDGVNILKVDVSKAENDPQFAKISSTYDYHTHMLREGVQKGGKKLVTFRSMLSYNSFPLANILKDLLEIGQREMNNPIEIEFAVDLNVPKGSPKIFSFLQIRPIVDNDQIMDFDWEALDKEETIISSDSALGNGKIENITDFVYVKPESFDPAKTKDIAQVIDELNQKFTEEDRHYVLIGPGRWGSSDPWLGVPIKWAQISQARVIIESGLDNYRIDPSQGTHFFQNLTSFRVGYLTINPFMNDGFYDIDFLNGKEAVYEDEYLRHVRFDEPVKIFIDGKSNKGAILKPNI
ncbi:MAG: phosphoenolpyruvate synthase [Bacteroidales bacterium]|jgi:DNA-binding NarL/FixJ family response regulator|nr:phosphoenolpyruvate synthase [Bacteroidales bacterium]